MIKKYDRPDNQKIIFDMMDRYIFKVTLDGQLVFEKTRQELAKHLDVSQATLKKYLDVWSDKRASPYRFFDSKIDKLGKFVEPGNKKILKAGNPETSDKTKKDNLATAPQNVLDTMSKFKAHYVDCKTSNNLSTHTLNNINLILDRFYDYIADEATDEHELSLNDMSKYFLSNYLNKLTSEGMGKNTQKLHATVIKNFFNFIADSDIKKYGFLRDKFNGIKIKTVQKEKLGLLQIGVLRPTPANVNISNQLTYQHYQIFDVLSNYKMMAD